jgi:tetratricopeptide (TPR) repeat protein
MHAELGTPPALFRTQLPQLATQPQTIAYPYGEWDEGLLQQVKQYGYTAGFTLRRDANPAFVPLLRVNRSQVLADWTLDDFKKNLSTFRPERIFESVAKEAQPSRPSPSDTLSIQQWAARHQRNAEILESNGLLAQALDESKIALTVDPDDASAQAQRKRLESRIEDEAARRIQAGMKLTRASPSEAQRHFLAALALNPTLQVAFEALRDVTATLVPPSATLVPPSAVKSITHTVRPNETSASIAELYYGDRSLGDVIEKENGLKPGAPLSVGQVLKIPEVKGVIILRPD